MNFYNIFIYLSLILTLTVTIAYSLADNSNQVSLHRVKRRGGKGRSRSSGRASGKSKTKIAPASGSSYPRQPSSHVDSGAYPKQPAYNPHYNPGGAAYPKQPGFNPNYNHAGAQQPAHFPSSYGQPAPNYGHAGYGYGQHGYANPGSRGGGFGGVGTGLAAGALGAAVGAYGGYQLGKMVGHSGMNGHYGYYDTQYQYVKCPPPPKIEFDPKTNITYIPINSTYDMRCSYFDREPPKIHPQVGQLNNSMGYYTLYTNSSGNYSGQWPLNSTGHRTSLAEGALGTAVGGYGSYKLGKMVGQSGLNGYFGYYDNQYQYVKCPPPPKIEFDSTTNISYIPLNVTYDHRCTYFEREPPKIHPYYSQQNSSMGYYSGFTNTSANTTPTNTTSTRIYVMTRTYRSNNNWKASSAPPPLMTSLLVIVSALVFDINILFPILDFF